MMDVEIRESGDVKIVEVAGKLNTTTAPLLDDALKEILGQETTKILLDFTELAFTASSGLRVIMAAGISLQKTGGEIKLCGLNEIIKDIFDMSGLDTMFKIYELEDDALADF
jgi:anti-sigma B factor antagonist